MKAATELLQPGKLGADVQRVGCVVVTYNSARHIGNCLRGLVGCDTVVVDNNSSDETCSIVQQEYPDVRIIRNARNAGLAVAFNVGWRSLPNDLVLLLNPDILTTGPEIGRLQAVLLAHPDVAVLAPSLSNFDGTPQESVRTFPTLATAIARRTLIAKTAWGRRVLAKHLVGTRRHGSTIQFVDWSLGAALLMRRAALESLSGYDEHYFLYCEDVDFCARAWQNRLAVAVAPDVTFMHEYQRASSCTFDLRSTATRAHLASTLRLAISYPKQYLFGSGIRPVGEYRHR
jgi:N-acetylglucosaminyl-diphospho-decaprenol L-rhamnosyltransferase